MAIIHSSCDRCRRTTTVTTFFNGLDKTTRLCFPCKSSVLRIPNTFLTRPNQVQK